MPAQADVAKHEQWHLTAEAAELYERWPGRVYPRTGGSAYRTQVIWRQASACWTLLVGLAS